MTENNFKVIGSLLWAIVFLYFGGWKLALAWGLLSVYVLAPNDDPNDYTHEGDGV